MYAAHRVAEREKIRHRSRRRPAPGRRRKTGRRRATRPSSSARSSAEAKKKRKAEEEKEPAFSLKRLHWYEFVGFLGALMLAGSLFLPWFATDCIERTPPRRACAGGDCNPNSVYNGVRGEFTAFETFKYLDWLLVAACVAPFILAYIVARGALARAGSRAR